MQSITLQHRPVSTQLSKVLALLCAVPVVAILIWQAISAAGNPNPLAPQTSHVASIVDIAVLVFREGLECILVLAAITAGLTGRQNAHRKPIAVGAGLGLLATSLTWCLAVWVLDDIGQKVPMLQLQAATGLLAIIVLLIVMNWFFHKLYWTGWIAMHNRKKRELLEHSVADAPARNAFLGMALLGLSSVYREGVEVVLFLQSYRLKLGNEAIAYGVLIGATLCSIVAMLTFLAHRKLPYRRMLVWTGALLGAVLFVMVGEQAQEMQLAHWISRTEITSLTAVIPPWMGVWFSVFPTIETLLAQALALLLVLGSYWFVERGKSR